MNDEVDILKSNNIFKYAHLLIAMRVIERFNDLSIPR